jgi:23S rRNA-/tRNA-specific pseudouridylate synthase
MAFNHTKIRLHKIVSQQIKKVNLEYSNPEIQKNISEFGVFVDKTLINDRLEWIFFEQKVEFEHWPKRQNSDFSGVRILEETLDYLLIYKPINVVVEPGIGHRQNNLHFWLNQKFNKCFSLVHRLDKNTQGLLLIAKNEESLDFFQNQFRSRNVTKKYLTIVEGILDKDIEITNFQTRDKINPNRQKNFWSEVEAKNYDSKFREAISFIKPLLICPDLNLSFVEVQIFTGRTHQIRLQCESLGFGIKNDLVYNKKIKPPEYIWQKNTKKEIQELSQKNFLELKKTIFGEAEFCLLNNFLKISNKANKVMEFELFNVSELFKK